jgi:hypothetical protein
MEKLEAELLAKAHGSPEARRELHELSSYRIAALSARREISDAIAMRDLERVKKAVARLQKIKRPRDLPQHFGFMVGLLLRTPQLLELVGESELGERPLGPVLEKLAATPSPSADLMAAADMVAGAEGVPLPRELVFPELPKRGWVHGVFQLEGEPATAAESLEQAHRRFVFEALPRLEAIARNFPDSPEAATAKAEADIARKLIPLREAFLADQRRHFGRGWTSQRSGMEKIIAECPESLGDWAIKLRETLDHLDKVEEGHNAVLHALRQQLHDPSFGLHDRGNAELFGLLLKGPRALPVRRGATLSAALGQDPVPEELATARDDGVVVEVLREVGLDYPEVTPSESH